MTARPNIIIITTDQQRTDTLGCYGAGHMRTPNLDRLAAGGVCFTRAYTVNPVCTPARVSLFTGVLPSRHGAWNVGVNYRGGELALSHQLRESGYRTHYVGKAHFNSFQGTYDQSHETIYHWKERYPQFTGPYYGFESVELSMGHTTYGLTGHYGAWVQSQVSPQLLESYQRATSVRPPSFVGEALDWDLPTRLHSSVWTADRTIAFLKQHDRQKPFLLGVGFQDPHHPHALPRDFGGRVAPEDVPLPDFTPGELADKPPHFLDNHRGNIERSWARGEYPVAGAASGCDYGCLPESAIRLGRAYYYSMVQLVDAQVGRILRELEERGLADNTIVVFTSDHGELLGDHGMWLKGPFLYEQLLRVPLIIRWPAGAQPQVTAALCSHVDLAPTLLAAAGVPPAIHQDGFDLAPLLRRETPAVRQQAFVECVDDPRKLRSKCVVTATRKLTWYCDQVFGELFDLEADPREKINQWENPAYATERARLLGLIIASLEPLEKRSPRHCYA